MHNSERKPKILIFTSFYLPGFKGGGPIRSIANLVKELAEDFDFMIVTRDRDLLDVSAYKDVDAGQWQDTGRAKVLYLPPSGIGFFSLRKILIESKYDIVYLNSFFDFDFSIKPVLLCRYFRVTKAPLLIAPRGEFSEGAISLSKAKKQVYIGLSNLLGLYDGAVFQASSKYESEDIARFLKVPSKNIRVAVNVPDISAPDVKSFFSSKLKVIFLSRITAKKNLKFAIEVLSLIGVPIDFHIYGPKEDSAYWRECEALISKLPPNIQYCYCGVVDPNEVKNVFSNYDVFLFPTLGENFGHVIAESLLAGTPVLISDQTPWRNLEDDGLGWDLPLDDVAKYSNVIEQLARIDVAERNNKRLGRIEKVRERLRAHDIISANKELFSLLLRSVK